MPVNLHDLFNRARLEEGRCDALLDAENDTGGGGYADCRGSQLNGFERVFDLEEAALWGEGTMEDWLGGLCA